MACSPKLSIEPVSTLEADNQTIAVYEQDDFAALLKTKSNKVRVINFWATWCAPCVKELPEFEKLNQIHNNDVDVTLVSLDFEETIQEKLPAFVNKKKLNSNVIAVLLEDEQAFIESVNQQWDGNIPATLIIYQNKQSFIKGKTSYEELLNQINSIKN